MTKGKSSQKEHKFQEYILSSIHRKVKTLGTCLRRNELLYTFYKIKIYDYIINKKFGISKIIHSKDQSSPYFNDGTFED